MPDNHSTGASETRREEIDLRGLARLAAWGAAAVAALSLTVFATRTEMGARRMAAALGEPAPQAVRMQAAPAPSEARAAELEFETRQLATAVRSLSTDRDRLLARVTVLERSLEDVTGSISRHAARPTPAPEPDPQPDADPIATSAKPVTIGPSVVATISSPLTIPAPSEESLAQIGLSPIPAAVDDNAATRTEFGVDIGRGATLAALRTSWASIRKTHASVLEGLHPVVAVRDSSRPGAVELRLIVGPLSNAASAVRLCGRLASAGLSCQPAVFDGQRLALR